MAKNNFEELKASSRKISQEIKNEAKGFFSTKSNRERLSTSRKIVIDPASFFIGGIGAVAIGSVADESNEGDREISSAAIFTNSTLRTIMYPIRTLIRFFTGGCIYVAVDSLCIHMLERRSPIVSGAITGLCFANGARTSVLLGSMLGMAVFSLVADIIFDRMLSISPWEI